MNSRFVIMLALSASILVGASLGALVSQVAPGDKTEDATSITGIGSGVDGAGDKKPGVETPRISQSQTADVGGVDTARTTLTETATATAVFTANEGAMQSIRGIKGIDTVMLQNLEAVLRMQTPPLPPQEGGGRAAALMTTESDLPPDPEAEPDGREELNEFEMEGS